MNLGGVRCLIVGLLLPWTAAASAGQVNIGYGDPGGEPAILHAHDVLVNSHALEELKQFLSPLRLPQDITLQADSCGAERRGYDPQTKTASICYEMIVKILDVAANAANASDEDRRQAVVGTIVATMFHETALALFDVLKVPVWGRAEDAADRFSALVMTQFGEDSARTTILGAARFFGWSARTWTGIDFSSAESPEAQRFYNFLCVAYGADPISFDDIATNGALPEYRAPRCAGEYAQVRKAFNLRIMPFVDPDMLVRARARNW
jgi:hypothetical protein